MCQSGFRLRSSRKEFYMFSPELEKLFVQTGIQSNIPFHLEANRLMKPKTKCNLKVTEQVGNMFNKHLQICLGVTHLLKWIKPRFILNIPLP